MRQGLVMDPVATVLQPRDAFPPIAQQPRVHALAADPVPLGDLGHRNPRADFQHGPVSLLGHAQLPQHERSVKHQAESTCKASSGTAQAGVAGAVTIFSTVSRAHLRRAGPDGPRREQRRTDASSERERAARVTRRKLLRFTRGSRRCGAAAFAASFGRKPYGAAAAAHGTPGNRPPAVPAVSRCRARQHHGQAVTRTPGAPIAVKMSQPSGRNVAHCLGRPLQRQGHPEIVSNRFAETIFGTHP